MEVSESDTLDVIADRIEAVVPDTVTRELIERTVRQVWDERRAGRDVHDVPSAAHGTHRTRAIAHAPTRRRPERARHPTLTRPSSSTRAASPHGVARRRSGRTGPMYGSPDDVVARLEALDDVVAGLEPLEQTVANRARAGLGDRARRRRGSARSQCRPAQELGSEDQFIVRVHCRGLRVAACGPSVRRAGKRGAQCPAHRGTRSGTRTNRRLPRPVTTTPTTSGVKSRSTRRWSESTRQRPARSCRPTFLWSSRIGGTQVRQPGPHSTP